MKKIYHNSVGVGKYTGLVLISPFIIGFVIFILYPFVCSFVTGLTNYDNIHQPEFIGFENYRNMFSDRNFRKAVGVTLRYTAFFVPLKIIVSLFTALLLSLEIKGIGIFRTAFYIPSILGANLAVVIMWQYLFTSDGLVNQFLEIIGLSSVSWYGNLECSIFIIILLRLWEFGSTMIIFLTALRDIPKEYYDAAKVDGCGKVKSFFLITLPLLKNVIFMNVVLQTIAGLQEFNAPYMITEGGPLKSTYTVGMLVYDEMFRYYNAGYANAVSWILFVMTAVVIFIMFRFNGRFREDLQ
ncbi:MAG: sugar ABC transporter permease [Ruminococcus sp.]|nr:sugar ABC transporter permease [Ruminococcus sp.]MDE6849307.1 sugar ABC transporter permease [Ruminococcus sp.]